MTTPPESNADDLGILVGSGLLLVYLAITIPVVMSAWDCAGFLCDLWLQILLAPVAIVITHGLSSNPLGIIIGIIITGSLMYLLGRGIGRLLGR